MPEISATDQAHSWYRMTLECDGHGFSNSCQCKERMQEVLVDLYDQLRRGPSQGIWQIVEGLEEMGALEKDMGGCPDSRIFAGIRELKERGEKSEENYQFMVKKAIDNHLPAYREMGMKLAAMEGERDACIAQYNAESKQVFEAEAQRDKARMALERTVWALEQSLAGKPLRDADEIIIHAQTILGGSNA